MAEQLMLKPIVATLILELGMSREISWQHRVYGWNNDNMIRCVAASVYWIDYVRDLTADMQYLNNNLRTEWQGLRIHFNFTNEIIPEDHAFNWTG